MLHTESITSRTLETLKQLMRDETLQDFFLVGDTALALYMGHRKSIDLDLFTLHSFDAPRMRAYLTDRYGLSNAFVRKDTVKGSIAEIKIDAKVTTTATASTAAIHSIHAATKVGSPVRTATIERPHRRSLFFVHA